jgi:hypothetical protein
MFATDGWEKIVAAVASGFGLFGYLNHRINHLASTKVSKEMCAVLHGDIKEDITEIKNTQKDIIKELRRFNGRRTD